MDDQDFPLDQVRSPQEVARRTLVLFGVWRLAMGSPRDEMLQWLKDNDLLKARSPDEVKFVDSEHPSSQQLIDLSWQSERLAVLLWALNLIKDLPESDTRCDTSIFEHCLPPFVDQQVEQFISSAALRGEPELWREAERMLDLHWRARDAFLNKRKPKHRIDIEVVQERHHAINWVTGYCGLDWDEVTTDT